MKLYSYFRSSAAFRVRIALNFKGVAYETVPVHLLKGGGEQLSEQFRRVNPQALVPVLQGDDWTLTQSLAIIEYLEERFAQPALLPEDPLERAQVRSIALVVACDIHPLNNLRVLRYLAGPIGADEQARSAWQRHWIELGLHRIEQDLAARGQGGRFAFGDRVSLADLMIVPQVFNARRVGCDLQPMPMLTAICDRCMQLDAFARAQPSAQPDAE